MNPENDIINEIALQLKYSRRDQTEFYTSWEQARKLKADEPGGFDGLVIAYIHMFMDRLIVLT